MMKTPALLTALMLATAPALTLPVLTLPAAAQTETPQGKEPPAAALQGRQATRSATKTTPDTYHAELDRRIAAMHRRLQITPEQETAWNGFAETMRQNANDVEQAYQKRASSLGTMSATDNLHGYAQIEQLRANDVQKLATSFDTLYGQLSDQQKQAADAMFRQYDVERRQAHQAAHAKAK